MREAGLKALATIWVKPLGSSTLHESAKPPQGYVDGLGQLGADGSPSDAQVVNIVDPDP